MSLLLTIDKQPLSKICIPSSLADSFLSCKNSTLHNNSFLDESGNEVPLVPAEGIQQLQMLILIFAIFHVLSCVLTFGLGEAKVKFYIYKFCKDEKKEVNTELKREAEFFGDIVIVPYMDSNDLLVFKTAAICEFGVRTISAKHMMKCDDDTFVRVDTLLDDLNDYPSNQSVYVGNMNVRHRTMRSRKWAVTH